VGHPQAVKYRRLNVKDGPHGENLQHLLKKIIKFIVVVVGGNTYINIHIIYKNEVNYKKSYVSSKLHENILPPRLVYFNYVLRNFDSSGSGYTQLVCSRE
jgi:hypothetical protein